MVSVSIILRYKINIMRITYTTLILLLALIVSAPKLHSQIMYPKQETANQLKDRTLIVELGEPDEKKLKKLGKKEKKDPGITQRYLDRIENYNTTIKESFTDNWTFHGSDKIEFRTKSEVDEIVKSKNKSYAIATFGWREESRTEQLRKKLVKYDVNCLAVYFAENAKKRDRLEVDVVKPNSDGTKWLIYHGEYVAKVSFPFGRLSSKENALMVKQLSYHLSQALKPERPEMKLVGTMEYGLFKEKAMSLKEKTLLIDRNVLEEGVTRETIAKEYPYKFEIVDSEEVYDKIFNSEGYAFMYGFWSDNQKKFGLFILDASNGETLIEIGTGQIQVGIENKIPLQVSGVGVNVSMNFWVVNRNSIRDAHFGAINHYIEKYSNEE